MLNDACSEGMNERFALLDDAQCAPHFAGVIVLNDACSEGMNERFALLDDAQCAPHFAGVIVVWVQNSSRGS
jgi:hypothetical protein